MKKKNERKNKKSILKVHTFIPLQTVITSKLHFKINITKF